MSDLDIMPLSDCLEGAYHPCDTPRYFGQEANIIHLEEALRSGRFHHGWIFSGPQGVGKATLSYHLARVLLGCKTPELTLDTDLLAASNALRDDKTGRLIAHFAHPDMRVLRRSYDIKTKKFFRNIRIDEMRALKEVLHKTPSMGLRRVALIDRAEDMNIASANALLKVLEEPPAHTTFILITSSPGQIPITVRSRCRMLKFSGLDMEDFEGAVRQQFEGRAGDVDGLKMPEAVNWQDLNHLAQGSVGLGIELMTGNGLRYYQALYKIFDRLPDLDERNFDMFVGGVLKDKTGHDYEAAVQLIGELLYRIIKGKVAQFPLSAGEKKLSEKLVSLEAIEQWLGLWDTLKKQAFEVNALNLDKKTHLMQSFFQLRDLVRQTG